MNVEADGQDNHPVRIYLTLDEARKLLESMQWRTRHPSNVYFECMEKLEDAVDEASMLEHGHL